MSRAQGRTANHRGRMPPAQLKATLLHHAARLIVQPPGMPSRDALRRAAHELGIGVRDLRIDEAELAEAVGSYRALFHRDAESTLREQRRTALEAMRFFADYQPRLVGPALEGTSSAAEAVQIQLFCDDEDAVLRLLDEHGMAFESAAAARYETPTENFRAPALRMLAGEVAVLLMILPERLLRQSLRRAGHERTERRADAVELARMLETP